MPKRVRLRDSRAALFSRQWYSTLCDLCEQDDAFNERDVGPGLLFAVPFFPLGSIDSSLPAETRKLSLVAEAIDDACERFGRIVGRLSAALRFRSHSNLEAFDPISKEFEVLLGRVQTRSFEAEKDGAARVLNDLRRLGVQLGVVAESARCLAPGWYPEETVRVPDLQTFVPASRSMDIRDVRELLSWHEFRIRLIESELDEAGGLERVVFGCAPREVNEASANLSSLTGYCCSGSWMVGALRHAHSPNIAWKVIEEVTSRERAIERSQAGAGIPPRKDFFDFHGRDKVTHASHLTWSDLLKFAGSRARRRDRTVSPAVSVSHASALIYRLLMNSLDASDSPQADAIAEREVALLFEGLRRQMKLGKSS